jgi:peptidyl-prolyl cis-trans isomerase SurA
VPRFRPRSASVCAAGAANLIDETLQSRKPPRTRSRRSQAEIDRPFARVGSAVQANPAEFAKFLRKAIGSSEAIAQAPDRGRNGVAPLLGRQVEPFVSVSDEEVNQVIARMKAAKGAPEYHVGEIFVSATPLNTDQVLANVNRIVQQVRQGASFVAYARQYSEASTAAVGGDLGWVRAEQLPEALGGVLPQMAPGTVTDPIPVGGGFSIINLLDKRQVLTADARDAVLALKQLSDQLPGEGTTQEGRAQGRGLRRRRCRRCRAAARSQRSRRSSIGAAVVDNDQIKVRDLPPALQDHARSTARRRIDPTLRLVNDGVRSLVLCGRDDAAVSSATPRSTRSQQQLEDERVNRACPALSARSAARRRDRISMREGAVRMPRSRSRWAIPRASAPRSSAKAWAARREHGLPVFFAVGDAPLDRGSVGRADRGGLFARQSRRDASTRRCR